MSDSSGLPPEYRPLAEEAMRLAGAMQDWIRRAATQSRSAAQSQSGEQTRDGAAATADPGDGPHSSDCTWCPVCQFAAVVRGERPDVTERLAEAGTVFLSAMRGVIEAASTATTATMSTATSAAAAAAQAASHARSEDVGDAPAPRVQKIDLGDAS